MRRLLATGVFTVATPRYAGFHAVLALLMAALAAAGCGLAAVLARRALRAAAA